MECIICYEGGNMTKTTCCTQQIHQKCLDQWLYGANSRGKCCFCRTPLRKLRGPPSLDSMNDFDDPLFLQNTWDNPQGFIYITSYDTSCDVTAMSIYDSVPIIHKVDHTDIDTIPDDYFQPGHLIVITENGQFIDTLNVPYRWITCVNGTNISMQLSAWMRLE